MGGAGSNTEISEPVNTGYVDVGSPIFRYNQNFSKWSKGKFVSCVNQGNGHSSVKGTYICYIQKVLGSAFQAELAKTLQLWRAMDSQH